MFVTQCMTKTLFADKKISECARPKLDTPSGRLDIVMPMFHTSDSCSNQNKYGNALGR